MDFTNKLISIRPSENSGSSSSNRFDYQKNWSLCKILELHSSGVDYVVAFEYHDDVIVLDSTTAPSMVKFYQVKTKKSGNWTMKQLLKIKKDAKHSMLGKLYSNKLRFPDETESLHFISNAKYNVELEDYRVDSKELEIICCEELSERARTEIENSLMMEHKLTDTPPYASFTYFEVDDLTIKHHVELTRDRLAQFVEKQLPGVEYKISPIYKTIFDAIRIKSNYEGEIHSYDQLLKRKAITKDDFQEILSAINNVESFKEKGTKIELRLNSENVSTGFIRSFRQNWTKLEIERMDKGNLILNQVTNEIKEIINNLEDSALDQSLIGCLGLVKEEFIRNSHNSTFYDSAYLEVIIISELYG